MRKRTTFGINPSFPGLSLTLRQIAYVLLTRLPLSQSRIATFLIPLDLHVLATPPAFTLSQNQTLQKTFKVLSLNLYFDSFGLIVREGQSSLLPE